jgi:ATP-binding cassette subfamily C (CFTR/MRP) protein 1
MLPPSQDDVREGQAEGAVGFRVYAAYFAAGGAVTVAFAVLLQAVAEAARLGSSVLLAAQLTDAVGRKIQGPGYDVGAYTSLAIAGTVLSGLGTVVAGLAAVSASRRLHASLLKGVLRAPCDFSDVTPLGRITNRFAADVQSVDVALPELLTQTLQVVLKLFACFLAVVWSVPALLGVLLPAVVGYGALQHYFRYSSRELKRLEDVARSPLFAHLQESLTHLTTVRAFAAEPDFVNRSMQFIDNHALVQLFLASAPRWLTFRTDVLGAMVVSCTAVACLRHTDTLSSGMAALCLSSALTFTSFVGLGLRMFTEVEMLMNAVIRIQEYCDLPCEADNTRTLLRPLPVDWPTGGAITFRNYTAAHRPGLPDALLGINIAIPGRQRVGICGRTGSGKSSLLSALCRMLHVVDGSLLIDGVDTLDVPLDRLRSSIAIIPQDPTLFAGTLRFNLDLEGLHSPSALHEALRVAQLTDVVQDLDFPVEDGGRNLSVGQRQLVCLARAFLRRARILCLDEATASVDPNTDVAIQRVLREEFPRCTILTVAHRIQTILDYDRILVLSDGRIVEDGDPAVLLRSNTAFRALVEASSSGSTLQNCEQQSPSQLPAPPL